jgi:hypothetical protein
VAFLARMVSKSKKKAKGQARARKAAKAKAQKEAEEKDSTSAVDDAAALEAQMQRLSVNNATNASSARARSSCNHGVDPTTFPDVCVKFGIAAMKRYEDALDNAAVAKKTKINPITEVFDEALLGEYREVLVDGAKMELMASFFVTLATTAMMDEEAGDACIFAGFAECFKQLLAALRKTQSCINWGKIFELFMGKYLCLKIK